MEDSLFANSPIFMSEDEIVASIEKHNRLYWEKNEPEISDEEYDALMRRLQEINPNSALLTRLPSPAVASSGKVRHASPMLSLDKAYSLDEVLNWANKCARNENETFLIQPKYDGISASFIGGVLATRGDGEFGENISDKIPLIELESPGHRGKLDRDARGEIVIRKDDFANIYPGIIKKDGKPYKNSRNAVAGIMGLKEISDILSQGAKITLVSYELFSYNVKLSELKSKWLDILSEIENLPYPMDGLVIKLADKAYSESLGFTAHHPRGEIAFKFSGIRKKSKILSVEWSFGKNCLTPIAEIEPVEIGGICIRHATLHNYQNVVEKDLHIGDIVTVERAGDVIPYIIESEKGDERKPCLIDICPSCASPLHVDGPELRCINPDCFETKLQRLLSSVKNIGIERLGEPNIRKMMLKLGVKSLKDIFTLTLEQVLSLEGYKDKSAANLLNEIAAAKNAPDYAVLSSLNIQGIGINIAKLLLSERSLDELRRLSQDELSEIRCIGPERAKAIFCELRSRSDEIDELIAILNVKESRIQHDNPKSSEMRPKICFTGKMPEKRSYYEGIAKARGFDPVDSVSKDLSLLVSAESDSASSKSKKAEKLGIKIASLDSWLNQESDI